MTTIDERILKLPREFMVEMQVNRPLLNEKYEEDIIVENYTLPNCIARQCSFNNISIREGGFRNFNFIDCDFNTLQIEAGTGFENIILNRCRFSSIIISRTVITQVTILSCQGLRLALDEVGMNHIIMNNSAIPSILLDIKNAGKIELNNDVKPDIAHETVQISNLANTQLIVKNQNIREFRIGTCNANATIVLENLKATLFNIANGSLQGLSLIDSKIDQIKMSSINLSSFELLVLLCQVTVFS